MKRAFTCSVTIQNRHYVQHTDDDIDAFNAKPSFGGGTPGGTVDTRNGAKRPKVAHEDIRLNTKKNAGEQVFSCSSQRRRVAVEGLEVVPKTLAKTRFLTKALQYALQPVSVGAIFVLS